MSQDLKIVPGRLQQLSRAGHLLGLITGNGDGAAFIKLSRGDLMRWFSFGAYASAGLDRAGIVRQAVQRGEAMLGDDVPNTQIYVIGDTPRDIECGKAVGDEIRDERPGEWRRWIPSAPDGFHASGALPGHGCGEQDVQQHRPKCAAWNERRRGRSRCQHKDHRRKRP